MRFAFRERARFVWASHEIRAVIVDPIKNIHEEIPVESQEQHLNLWFLLNPNRSHEIFSHYHHMKHPKFHPQLDGKIPLRVVYQIVRASKQQSTTDFPTISGRSNAYSIPCHIYTHSLCPIDMAYDISH